MEFIVGWWDHSPSRRGRLVRGQSRRDDVAGLAIAVGRHVLRPVVPRTARRMRTARRRSGSSSLSSCAGRVATSTRLRSSTQPTIAVCPQPRDSHRRDPPSASSTSAGRAADRRSRPSCTSGSSRVRTARRRRDGGKPRSPAAPHPTYGSRSRPSAAASTSPRGGVELRTARIRRRCCRRRIFRSRGCRSSPRGR